MLLWCPVEDCLVLQLSRTRELLDEPLSGTNGRLYMMNFWHIRLAVSAPWPWTNKLLYELTRLNLLPRLQRSARMRMKELLYEHLACDEAVMWTYGTAFSSAMPLYQQERVRCYMNDGHVTKLLYERLACNQAVYIWTFDMWWSCYMNVWHVKNLLYERLVCDEAQCYMNAWHVTKLSYENLACDEAVIWTSGMWRNCYMNAWHGFVLCHGCYKGRWNSATLMNFWPARPFSFAMFAVITKNEGTIIWTSGMAFSALPWGLQRTNKLLCELPEIRNSEDETPRYARNHLVRVLLHKNGLITQGQNTNRS